MSKILITGGTGLLGSEIVNQLISKNIEVSILSTQSNPVVPKGVKVFEGNLITGKGLSVALENVERIIHCASNPKEFQETDILGTQNLISAINRAKFSRFAYISIVGIDKSSYPYYSAKKVVEEMIRKSGIPHTILRTTQFHHFVLNLIKSILENDGEEIKVPDGMSFQSIDISEVAEKLIEMALLKASKGIFELGGPQLLSFEDMFSKFYEVFNLQKTWSIEPLEGVRFDLFRSGKNLCPEKPFGNITWEAFIKKIELHH